MIVVSKPERCKHNMVKATCADCSPRALPYERPRDRPSGPRTRGMIRCFRYPLHPTKAQEAVLVAWLGMCCDLYNGALEERRNAWRQFKQSVSFYEQLEALTALRGVDSEWWDLPRAVAASALARLDNGYKTLNRCNEPGDLSRFPRFRSKSRYRLV